MELKKKQLSRVRRGREVKPQSEYSLHITKTPTQTHILQNPHTHTHTHTTKEYETTTVQIKTNSARYTQMK